MRDRPVKELEELIKQRAEMPGGPEREATSRLIWKFRRAMKNERETARAAGK